MSLDPSIAPAVSAALTRIGARNAFFGALVLFARYHSSAQVPTAATDGRDIYVNNTFFSTLSADEQEGLLLHEVLHAALLHVPRRGGRDPLLWNIAADIVINGMLLGEGYALPEGGLRDKRREKLSAEEIYELLLRDPRRPAPAPMSDLIETPPGDAGEQRSQGARTPGAGSGRPEEAQAPGSQAVAGDQHDALRSYWEQALQQARLGADSSAYGKMPGGVMRELEQIRAGRLDWRTLLWRHMVRSAVDFQGFDRRFVGQGLYLDALDGETLSVAVAVDTSGSIDQESLGVFVGEVQRVLRTYPHLRCELYFADTALHGPHILRPHTPMPAPVGGGGTDFRPFFKRITRRGGHQPPTVAIYLTDGYGSFPDRPPPIATLWVLLPSGLALDKVPFGQAVRLLTHEVSYRMPDARGALTG